MSTRVALTAQDAVALVVQLARSPQMGRPSGRRLDPSHVWLNRDGEVTLSPGLLPPLSEVADFLHVLLSDIRRTRPDSVPTSLLKTVERAAGLRGGVGIPTLSAFAAALGPYQPADPASAIRDLVARFEAAPASAELVHSSRPPVPVRPEPAAPRPLVSGPSAVPVAQPSPSPPLLPPVPPALVSVPAAAPSEPAPAADTPWRPSPWHVTGAITATVLAALIGSAIGRASGPENRRDEAVSATPARSAARPHPASAPAPTPTPEPKPKPEPEPEPEPMAQPAKPVAPRPARLVDRRAVHADGVFSPSFAPHGSAVFFHAEEGSESALKRADADDHGELRVATIVDDGARNYHVQQSPDGTSIAFDSDREGERGVYVAKADGTGVRRVSGPGYAAVPTWAPDGRRLAFLRAEPDRASVWNLWLLDRDSGKQTRVTSFRRGQVWGGAWFADGKRIAYSHEDRLSIRDLASDETREFPSPLRGRLVRTPAVSPDGRWIVFQVYRDGAWLLDVERGTMQRVLQDPSAEEFAWSPDGRRVAYHSQRSGGWNLWTMAAP